MAKASPIILSFSSGELAPLFDGRVDLEEYAAGSRRVENFITLIEGPALRRAGTRFVHEVKDSTDRCGFLRFEFNVKQAYVLEIGDQYMRFYTDHGIVLNGTNPLELATPWVAADLFDANGNFLLRSVQSGDVLYITHTLGTYPAQKLTRSAALSWTLEDLDAIGGPFEDIDPDETTTVYASSTTGSVSVTASTGIFSQDHVGALFLIEKKSVDDVRAWEAGKAVSTNDFNRVDHRNYKALNTATTGTIVPTHTSGAAYDGATGTVQWQFMNPGYGWGVITAVNSDGTVATITVLSNIPGGAVGSGNATTRWAFGSWSEDLGYPTHVTFFRDRLVFMRAQSRKWWMSVAGDYENFKDKDDGGEVVADSAITGEIVSNQVDRLQWIEPTDDVLMIGTAGGEFVLREITTSEPLGPGNVKAQHNSNYGGRNCRPLRIGDSVLFVQRSGRKLRDLSFSIEKEKFASSNLNILSSHLLPKGKGITALAYAQEPNSVIWAMRSDGLLLGATINANQRRFGWHRHPVGGSFDGGDAVVEAIEEISTPEADANELWLIVKRTVDGATVRYVEYMEQEWDRDQDIGEAFYVDCGLTYDGAVAQTLTPGVGADVVNTEGVFFTAGGSAFISGHIGKEIRYRYQDEDDAWQTARAEITAVLSATVVEATIISAFPSTDAIDSEGWRITASAISGLDHLEGEVVDVLVDGASHPQLTVASGSVTLVRQGALVHIGLPCPAVIAPMRVEAGSVDGTAQGKTKRIHRAVLRFVDTVGGKAGPDEDHLDEIPFRDASMSMDDPVPPFSGDKRVLWPDGYGTDGLTMYLNDQPLPATLVAVMPQLETADT